MFYKVVFLVAFLFAINSCQSQITDDVDLRVQAKVYASSYIKHFGLENFDVDFYYYISSGSEPGKLKLDELYHIDGTRNIVNQTKIRLESLEQQFYELLRRNGSDSFTSLAQQIDKEVIVYKPSNCTGIENIITKVSSSVGKEKKGKLSLDVDNRYHIFQYATGKHDSVYITITTSDTSLPVIETLLQLRDLLKNCEFQQT